MDAQERAQRLAERIKHYLVTTGDSTLEEATEHQLYHALSRSLRQEIMVNWAASRQILTEGKHRTLYYLSMEYLPGRILGNNITNMGYHEIVAGAFKLLGKEYQPVREAELDPGLGNGGLGRLASCFLDSLATLQYPALGYGLRYQYGIFEQEVWGGVQVERPDNWLLQHNPWDARRDLYANHVEYCGKAVKTANRHGDEVYDLSGAEEVRALPYDLPIVGYCKDPNYSVLPLRLWSTKESPRNFELQSYNAGRLGQAAENTTLTDVLYPVDVHETGRRVRLKQEFLLVSASVQDIIHRYAASHSTFDQFADRVRIQINDTHPALVVPELMRLLTRDHDVAWDTAWEMTQEVVGFTQHTVLAESLEQWEQELFQYLLPRQYRIVEQINHNFLSQVRERYPSDEEKVQRLSILQGGKVHMARLALVGAHRVNGVAQLHTDILKESVFRDFYELTPERFVNVTNGVTQRRWLLHANPDLAGFITSKIGEGWITDLSQLRSLQDFAHDESTQNEFLAIKRRNKERLIHYIRTHSVLHDHHGRPLRSAPHLDPDSLFDIHIKRIHEYKRQLLNVLHTIMLYQELCDNPQARKIKRTVFFGGKAAAGYVMAKNIIRLIFAIARKINSDTTIGDSLKVIFIENYNVSRAQVLIPACDLSQQISTAGWEASGTGNMKLSMNGALTIGTEDGANIEMREQVGDQWWPFRFGHTADEIAHMTQERSYNPWDIYSAHPEIRRAIDTLRNGTFAVTEDEEHCFSDIYSNLLESEFGAQADRFFLLKDLPAYHETQKKVEELYAQPHAWAEMALHNIAGMGYFSTDRSMHEYAEKIWGIAPVPPSDELIAQTRAQYEGHMKVGGGAAISSEAADKSHPQ
jgi:glycogen phosphorylase